MLTMLLACPLVGMLLVLALPKTAVRAIRLTALCATGAAMLIGVQLLNGFDPQAAGVQFHARYSWIHQMNIFYHVGIDGISLPMILLTVVLGFLACAAALASAYPDTPDDFT